MESKQLLSILKKMENVVTILAPSFFIGCFFIFTGNKNNHKTVGEFEVKVEPTSDCGVNFPWA